MKILHVVGARPNFIKMAPILEALGNYPQIQNMLVHTGQHYDYEMSGVFFQDLEMPKPDYFLGQGKQSDVSQVAGIMSAFESLCLSIDPDLILVPGDVNSTLGCALTAQKLGIKLGHIESGLRSFDREMPEEINRILTDQLSDLLFTTEASAKINLQREGINSDKIHFVGNTMIDTLFKYRGVASQMNTARKFGLEPNEYALVTLHRPSNVDDEDVLERLIKFLNTVSEQIPILFPVHPRTAKKLEGINISNKIKMGSPMGYLPFISTMASARMVLTDSGGIQEETTGLGVPCLTLRKNTERPITVDIGTNTLVKNLDDELEVAVQNALIQEKRQGFLPELWDGKAAQRIAGQIIAPR